MGDQLKDVADAMGASVKALDAEAVAPGFFHNLLVKTGSALVGVVEAGARAAILAAVPVAFQSAALDFEKAAEEWIDSKISGRPIELSHATVAALHDDLAAATDAAIATFVAPKVGATGAGVLGKLAHALEDGAANALPQEPHV